MSRDDIVVTQVEDADTAFEHLAAMVDALEGAVDQRPQSTDLNVAQLKRFIADPTQRVRLNDLLANEVDFVRRRVADLDMQGELTAERYTEHLHAYEQATAGLLRLLSTGACFADRSEHDKLPSRCVEQLAGRPVLRSGLTSLLNLQQYPTTLALYAIGIGAAHADRLDPFAQILATLTVPELANALPVAVAASASTVLDEYELTRALPALDGKNTPVSDHLLEVLKPAVADVVRDKARFEDLFDEVEFVLGMAYESIMGEGHGPHGRAAWRSQRSGRYPGAMVERHTRTLISAGLFERAEQLDACRVAYDESLRRSRLRF